MVSDVEDDQAKYGESPYKWNHAEPPAPAQQIHALEPDNEGDANPEGGCDSSEPIGAKAVTFGFFGIPLHGIRLTQPELSSSPPHPPDVSIDATPAHFESGFAREFRLDAYR
jgi:hypothetical protein